MKICPVGAEFFHAVGCAEGRTGRHDEAKGRLRNFANVPKSDIHSTKHLGTVHISNHLNNMQGTMLHKHYGKAWTRFIWE